MRCSGKINDGSRTIVTVVSLWNCNSVSLIIHNNYVGGTRRISWSEGHKFCPPVRRHFQFTSQPSITSRDAISTDKRSTPVQCARVILCIICQRTYWVQVQVKYTFLGTLPNKEKQHSMSETYCWVTTVVTHFTDLIQYKLNSQQISQYLQGCW